MKSRLGVETEWLVCVQGAGDRLVFADVDTDAVLTLDENADLVTDEVRRSYFSNYSRFLGIARFSKSEVSWTLKTAKVENTF